MEKLTLEALSDSAHAIDIQLYHGDNSDPAVLDRARQSALALLSQVDQIGWAVDCNTREPDEYLLLLGRLALLAYDASAYPRLCWHSGT